MAERIIQQVTDNADKQRTYRENIRRFNNAMKQEFYFEALLIDYAILEDRLSSILFHIGALANRTDRKICSKVKKQLRDIVRRYETGEIKLTVTTISGKERIIRAVAQWAMDTRDLPETDRYLAVLKEQWSAVDGIPEALDDLDHWRDYRNEVIHGLMNKNVDSLGENLSGRCMEGMRLARFFDSQLKLIKRGNLIRRSLRLNTN
jgi:hypothetical protein